MGYKDYCHHGTWGAKLVGWIQGTQIPKGINWVPSTAANFGKWHFHYQCFQQILHYSQPAITPTCKHPCYKYPGRFTLLFLFSLMSVLVFLISSYLVQIQAMITRQFKNESDTCLSLYHFSPHTFPLSSLRRASKRLWTHLNAMQLLDSNSLIDSVIE